MWESWVNLIKETNCIWKKYNRRRCLVIFWNNTWVSKKKIEQKKDAAIATPLSTGGPNRARTYDPLLVRQMLSQLSYGSKMVTPRGIEPLLLPWKGSVLTAWPRSHIIILSFDGDPSGIRTRDTLIKSQVLCLLS